MKKNQIVIAIITVFAAASAAMAAEGTIGSLSGTGDKISAVDMKKDLNKAGNILDGFFSGFSVKKNSEQPAAVKTAGSASAKTGPARNIYGQTAKELSNAEPAKKTRLASAVKQLPVADQTRGAGGSSWMDDFHTVTDYVGNVGSAAANAGHDAYNTYTGTWEDDHNITTLPGHVIDTYQAATCTD